MADPFTAFCAAGLWPGLGTALAGRLAEAGIRTPADVTPARLGALAGVGPARADRLVGTFAAAAPAYAVAELLTGADLPVRLAAAAVEVLGDSAAGQLRADPWRLLELAEVRPPDADGLSRMLVGPGARRDARRGRALAGYVLARAARDGHTALPTSTVAAALAGLDVPDDPAAAIADAVTAERLLRFPGEPELLALPRYAAAEQAIAAGLARLTRTALPLAKPADVASFTKGLDPAQAAAVQAVSAYGVSILTGGPGTGKSRTVAAVVALASARDRRLALAAPTGRAAKRLEELTGEPAQTVHRLLAAQGPGGGFARGRSWPLDADVVVVDEASMLDVELAAAVVDACADGTYLLLVGDPAQLPSIGAGRVLADLLDAGTAPATELTTLHRQAEGGAIARLATAVRGGELPPVDDPDREVVVVPARGSEEAARRTVQLVTDSIPRALGIPAEDVQVVTPVHRGPAGTVELNAVLKARLNPGPGAVRGFDVGDRVVATANHPEAGFANGEVGTVTTAAGGGLVVAFAAGSVTVPAMAVADLRHGWANTVHRAQGSEWPAVVIVLPGESAGLLSRPLVYTALTRAQRHLSVVHAAGPAVARAVREVGARPRRTRLRKLLEESLAPIDSGTATGRKGGATRR